MIPRQPTLIFDFASGEGAPRRLCFSDPISIVVAQSLSEVAPALRTVEAAVARGAHAAGYVSYEAAPAFDPAFDVHVGPSMPLVWFGVFGEPVHVTPLPGGEDARELQWQPDVSHETYANGIARIRNAVWEGAAYQVNYTMRLRTRFHGDPYSYYSRMRDGQRAHYCAYLDLGRFKILSASPELFFRRDGDHMVTRPMKGTVRRGRWSEEDDKLAAWLASSEKNRAENLMIVDLIRNDLGRLARIGTVRVPSLYDIERYPTLHQMTSTITATLRPGTTLTDIFAALFPCGSITGAPKISAMQLIAETERSPREAYCGAIGFISPRHEAVFNVAIRTLVIDSNTSVGEYGVGGGITWDSTAADEYAEARLKASLLSARSPDFDLLETLRLENGVYRLLERHLERVMASARFFGIPARESNLRKALDECLARRPRDIWLVRLLVSADGKVRAESTPLEERPETTLPIALAGTPVSRADRFLQHKTTNRRIYDEHRSSAADAYDVLLWNEDGEVTEFTTGNLVLEIGGERWTPPRESGLLPGTLRGELLARGEIRERVLTRADFDSASRRWFINSVRGWIPVEVPAAPVGTRRPR